MTENLKEKAIIFGNMNPPTLGHQRAVLDGLIPYANNLGIDHAIYTSKRHFKKPGIPHERTPLNPELKLSFLAKAFKTPNVRLHTTPFSAIQELLDSGYHRVHIMLGSDRVEDTGPKLVSAFGDRVKIVPFGAKREEGAAGLAGVSSTRLRKHAASGDFEAFKTIAPEMDPQDVEQLYHHVREGLKAARTPVLEEVSAQTRLKLARVAKRTARRRAMLRKARQRRRRNIKQLKKRAKQNVKGQLRHRYYGKGNWSKLSYSTRARIDQNVNKRKKIADTMIRRILPNVIKGESERLQRLTKKEDVEIQLDMILEAVRGSRKVRSGRSGANSAKERAGARARKQKQRTNEKVAKQQGDIAGKYAVVTASSGKYAGRIMVVDKNSYNPAIHNIVVSPDKFSMSSGQKILDDDNFINTDSSIELYGKVGGEDTAKMGKSKRKAVEFSSGKKKKKSAAPKQEEPAIQATKKASKKDSFNTSHGATEMETGIVFAVNSMLGLKPKDMVAKGLIDQKDLDAVMKNPHASYMESCQRAAQQLMKAFGPGVYLKHTGRLKKETKLSKEAVDGGVRDNTPKSDLLVVDAETGETIAGLSQKIGESQLASGGPAETALNLKWAMRATGGKMDPATKKKIDNFIKFFENELSGNPRTKAGPTDLYKSGGELEGKDVEVARREKLHQKATDMLEDIMNTNKDFAAAFTYSILTGAGKFKEGDPAIATHILSANRDGTDLKATPITMDYASKLSDKVKFKMRFKSSAVETTDIKKKWEDFKAQKQARGEKVKLTEDFRPYAFRSVVRVLAPVSEMLNFSVNFLMKFLVEERTSSALNKTVPPEPTNEEEAIQYLKDAFNYIGDDMFKLYQFFEDSVDFGVSEPIIDWTQLAVPQSSITNTVYVNGKEFTIPVEDPYNYTPGGSLESPLSENTIMEKRNYRKEYDNYHSKPEQRRNRSKRVLARRLMTKLGRVKKGDGKDVDHKDGNPQNNGKSNLRVRSKSENRADND